jgi:hypothetical protein
MKVQAGAINGLTLTALAFAAAFALSFAGTALASTTHWGGGGGSHSSGSHGSNPGHVWVSVGSPKDAGHVSSGGRYHDCVDSNGDGIFESCHAADGGDWANDVTGTGGGYLYMNYAGYGSGASVTPNQSRPIAIYGYVAYQGTWSGQAACVYQRYEIWVEYYDTGGTYHFEKVGYQTIGHAVNWAYSTGSWIYPNASRSLPEGGTVSYVDGAYIGDTYQGSPVSCNGGTHLHLEAYSAHDYGAQYEWHGEGPESFNYSTAHLHQSWPSPWDDATWGTVMGFVGGGSYSVSMWDNPNYAGH